MRAGKAKKPVAPPVSETVVLTTGSGLDQRLGYLGLPPPVVELIMKTTYEVNGMKFLLFGIAPSALNPQEMVYNPQEIQEIVRVYDLIKGQYVATGAENDPVRVAHSSSSAAQTKIISDDEALAKFTSHIEELVLNKQMKAAKNYLVHDDSVFESPALSEYRRQEILKINLLNRKRVPIKGIKCARKGCASDEIYQEELFTRAGDEGGVWHNTCSKCGHFWKN